MSSRRDEWFRRTENDLRYCVVCERHLSPIAWAEHEHNPNVSSAEHDDLAFLDHLMSDVVYLGGVKVSDCASIVVAQGVEVFRLRDRDGSNRIKVDLQVDGSGGARIAKIENGVATFTAPGYVFEDLGHACAVIRQQDGTAVVAVESVSSKAVQILGTLYVGDFGIEMTGDALKLGGVPVATTSATGSGTAIVLRKKKAEVGFAKR